MEEKNNPFSSHTSEEDKKAWEEILNGNQDSTFPPLTPEEEDLVWKNIFTKIREREKEKRRIKIIRYGIAASIAIILMTGCLIGYNSFIKSDIYLAESANKKIQLADGSIITLSKGAKLTVEKSFPGKTRVVELEGDALFEVAKSKEHPFIVHGQNYETKVLGTVFKVIQDGSTFKVDLFEGQVAVKKTATKKEYFMAPGQTFSNYGKPDIVTIIPLKEDQNKAHSYEVNDSKIRLSFSDCTIKNAIEVIEKTYQIKVEYPPQYADHKISLDNINVTPKAILGTISAHLDLKLNIDDTTYRLEK